MFKPLAAGALALATSTVAAHAATPQECRTAVHQAQHLAGHSITLKNDTQKSMRFSQMMALAIHESFVGNDDKCLQIIRNARGGFGLPQ